MVDKDTKHWRMRGSLGSQERVLYCRHKLVQHAHRVCRASSYRGSETIVKICEGRCGTRQDAAARWTSGSWLLNNNKQMTLRSESNWWPQRFSDAEITWRKIRCFLFYYMQISLQIISKKQDALRGKFKNIIKYLSCIPKCHLLILL